TRRSSDLFWCQKLGITREVHEELIRTANIPGVRRTRSAASRAGATLAAGAERGSASNTRRPNSRKPHPSSSDAVPRMERCRHLRPVRHWSMQHRASWRVPDGLSFRVRYVGLEPGQSIIACGTRHHAEVPPEQNSTSFTLKVAGPSPVRRRYR